MDQILTDPQIETEVCEHRRILGEIGGGTPTALDGLVRDPACVLSIESKFGEPEFGGCSQARPSTISKRDARYDPEFPNLKALNCTGAHAVGSDLKSTTKPLRAACRLTVQDGARHARRYWEVAPSLFRPEILSVPRPCPFAGDAYQLMRSLAFASEWAKAGDLVGFGFLVTVDASPFAAPLRTRVEDFRGLLDSVRHRVGVVCYERIAEISDGHGERGLATWTRDRVARVFPRD
jgi:hypothetical protein